MLEKTLRAVISAGIDKNPARFMVIPAATLSHAAQERSRTLPRSEMDRLVGQEIVSGQKNLVADFSPIFNAIAANRHKFLELGGFDQDFRLKTYAELDFLWRLIKNCAEFEAGELFHAGAGETGVCRTIADFLSVCGIIRNESLKRGLILSKTRNDISGHSGEDFKGDHEKLLRRISAYSEPAQGPEPLVHASAQNRRCLVLSGPDAPFAKITRALSPYLGEFYYKWEWDFARRGKFSPEKLMDYALLHDIDLIIMQNPYYSAYTQAIHNYLAKMNFPVLIWDRGALPDSWLFDSTGFNADSRLFAPAYWDRPLTEAEKAEVMAYMEKIKNSDNYLEAQGARSSSGLLKDKLGLTGKKVVFIPMQVESDTVIQFFTKAPFDYHGFMRIANQLAEELADEGWVFIAKKHPLAKELNFDDLSNIIRVPDDANISVLLEMCDVVMLLNSGVGVYAMLYEKPCLVCGRAFYEIPGINISINTPEEILSYLRNGDFSVDAEKIRRFIFYLCRRYYCFGRSEYKMVEKRDRLFNLISAIDYYRIVLNGVEHLDGQEASKSCFG